MLVDCLAFATEIDAAELPAPAPLPDAFGAERSASGKIIVECATTAGLEPYRDAWVDLSRRALDPNVFLDPAFAFPLFQHLGCRSRLTILLVWEDCGPALLRRLLGVFPLELSNVRYPVSYARVFAHAQMACGTPLVDRERADAVFEALAGWLDTHPSRPDALILTSVAREGALAAALAGFAADARRSIEALEVKERAVLHRRDGLSGGVASFASAKRRKERARQFRRLSETGTCTYASARAPHEVATAMERFLALEDRGWKGARRTSLLAAPVRATFARTMARLMARDGKCRIDAIEIDGKPVAMGIVLTDADRAYYWKTAFDEAYASFSPGVQLTLELSRTQLADPRVIMTDSCAVSNHPMIDRLWPDRTVSVDLILSVRASDHRFDRSVRVERWRRAFRRRAKAVLHGVRRLRQLKYAGASRSLAP